MSNRSGCLLGLSQTLEVLLQELPKQMGNSAYKETDNVNKKFNIICWLVVPSVFVIARVKITSYITQYKYLTLYKL
jgi:hypothetical protein